MEIIDVTACRCERISEKEFDEHPELNEEWEEIGRKDGYVYIGFRPNKSLHFDAHKAGRE